MSGSGINWAICKSAPRSRQITAPAPHHSVFAGRMPFLSPNQQHKSTKSMINIDEGKYGILPCNITDIYKTACYKTVCLLTKTFQAKQVCIQPRPLAVNMTLPAFDAECRAAAPASAINRHLLQQGTQQQTHCTPLSTDGTERQTDGCSTILQTLPHMLCGKCLSGVTIIFGPPVNIATGPSPPLKL